MPKLIFWSNVFAYIFVFYLLLREVSYCKGYNYCSAAAENELCGKGKHIMCHEDLLPKQGELKAIIPMTKKVRKQILNKHNEFRSMISSGTISSTKSETLYPKAARMREMLWDYELALVAEHHASQCSFNHDSCRKTTRFKYAGQNLGSGSTSGNITIKNIIKIFDSMYEEKNIVDNPVEFAKKFVKGLFEAGHFSVIVNDRSSFVGCGIALCSKPNEYQISYYLLTCNYEYTNMLGAMIYKIDDSESASQCSDWGTVKSETFEHLCKNNGRLFPVN